MKHKMSNAQSIFEYILLAAGVTAVAIAFLGSKGGFSKSVESILNASVDQVNEMVEGIPNYE